jgi:hypothetical protein
MMFLRSLKGPSDDARIFFYPLSFGNLADQYTILCLKRASTKSIKRQQELDYRIFRARRSIETNLIQLHINQQIQDGLVSLFENLFRINAQLWRLNDLARDEKLPLDARKENYFLCIGLGEKRDNLIRQLDILVNSKSVSYRVFNGMDV